MSQQHDWYDSTARRHLETPGLWRCRNCRTPVILECRPDPGYMPAAALQLGLTTCDDVRDFGVVIEVMES